MVSLDTGGKRKGGRISDFIRITIYLTDRKNWAAMNEVYRKYINEEKPPARLCCQVGLNVDYQVGIDGIAVIDQWLARV